MAECNIESIDYSDLVSCSHTLFPAGELYCLQYKHLVLKRSCTIFWNNFRKKQESKEQNAGILGTHYSKYT